MSSDFDPIKSKNALPAGKYLVGDPCYAFDNDLDENWQEWLDDSWEDGDGAHILEGLTPQGHRVVASGTQYGDGTYEDGDGFEYGVDAGLLGAVRVDMLTDLYPSLAGLPDDELEERTGMRVVEFGSSFSVSYEAGWVTIGHISINTGDADDDDSCKHCGDECEDMQGRACVDQPDEDEDEDEE